jgi:arylsulfatase A-like enzyme
VLLYIVDSLRADAVGVYSHGPQSTPAIDRFAREGVVFGNAFANSSSTRASVGSIVTGWYAHRHGASGQTGALDEDVDSLADLLSRNGYATAFVNANPNTGAAFGFAGGFDEMIELYDRREPGRVDTGELTATTSEVSARALDWIRQARRPFFMVVLVVDPHEPYTPPRSHTKISSYSGRVDGELSTLDLPATELNRGDRAHIRTLYDSEVRFVDESFGALIDGLRSDGTLDRTLAIFTSDHGEEFWEYDENRGHGKSLTDPAIHVPLLVRFPEDARVAAGRGVARDVELVDIVPTVLDLTVTPWTTPGDGRSLLTAPEPENRPIYSNLDFDGTQMETVRSFPWKLVWDGNQNQYRLYLLRSSRRERRASAITSKNRPAFMSLHAHLDEVRAR